MRIFAALREDIQQGWVWLQSPTLPARSIVKITNPSNGKSIYCEALQIDKNFLDFYNQPKRITISDPQNTLVISGWYRAALGDLFTKSDVHLCVKPSNSLWGKFKACIHHPQIIVRVAAWLGLVSVLLGLLGAVLGAMSLWASEPNIADAPQASPPLAPRLSP
jgi:hypothetical protein